MKTKFLNQKGDTIIEVLIAVAVVGFILSTSYALANRSSTGVRASQERGEALKLSEAQLEKLKLHLGRENQWPDDGVCILDDGSVADNPGACAAGGRYSMSIQETATNQYRIATTWDRVGGGQAPEQLELVYRVHDDLSDNPDYEPDPGPSPSPSPSPGPSPSPSPPPSPSPSPSPSPGPCYKVFGC